MPEYSLNKTAKSSAIQGVHRNKKKKKACKTDLRKQLAHPKVAQPKLGATCPPTKVAQPKLGIFGLESFINWSPIWHECPASHWPTKCNVDQTASQKAGEVVFVACPTKRASIELDIKFYFL